MTRPRIFVTRRWPSAVEAELARGFDVVRNESDRPLTGQELREALASADGLVASEADRIGADVLGRARPRARILANFSPASDHVDLDAARALGIAVTSTPDPAIECAADFTMALMLNLARRIGEAEEEARQGPWRTWRPLSRLGVKVSGKTLAIVGFGRVGRAVAARAHFGFGMRILVHDARPVPRDHLERLEAEEFTTLEALLPRADFVSLHCPDQPSGRYMIDARRLGLMKPGAFLVNTAGANLVNPSDLADALAFETIAGAAVDAFDVSPATGPHVCDALRGLPNAILTPRLASATCEAREAMGLRLIENLRDFFDGRPPRDRVI